MGCEGFTTVEKECLRKQLMSRTCFSAVFGGDTFSTYSRRDALVVRLRLSADEEQDHRLRQFTDYLKQLDLSVRECFCMGRLQTLKGCLNVLRVSHAI